MDISRAIIYSLDAMTTWIIGGVLLCVAMGIVYGVCLMMSCALDMFDRGE